MSNVGLVKTCILVWLSSAFTNEPINICAPKPSVCRDTSIHSGLLRDKVATAPRQQPKCSFAQHLCVSPDKSNPPVLADQLGDVIAPEGPGSDLESASHAWNTSKWRYPWETLPGPEQPQLAAVSANWEKSAKDTHTHSLINSPYRQPCMEPHSVQYWINKSL